MLKLLSITLVNSAYTVAHSQLSKEYKPVKSVFANINILGKIIELILKKEEHISFTFPPASHFKHWNWMLVIRDQHA